MPERKKPQDFKRPVAFLLPDDGVFCCKTGKGDFARFAEKFRKGMSG